jgi:xylulokinase
MTGPFVIGCDVGSQGTNAALYDADGTHVASAYREHALSFPHPGWAEQDTGEWIRALHETVGRLVEECPSGAAGVRAISFASQLDGMVACDSDGQALRPALIWMDRRAEQQASDLAARMSPGDFYANVGVNLDSSHALFKALWIRDTEPDVFAKTRLLLPPGAFVLREATGVPAVDYSNASSLGLLDPHSLRWSEPVLEAAGVDSAMLPRLAPGTDQVGRVTSAFAEATGLSPETLVVLGCGDEMAATLGAGVHAPGDVCDVAGTAEPVCAVAAGPCEDATMLVECHPHAYPGSWLLENPGFVSGGNLRWWRDQFGPLERQAEASGAGDAYDLLVGDAAEIAPGSDGVLFLPCMQGAMAPEWNGAARGAFFGLTLAHSRAHLTRAILEASAFALTDILQAMRGAGLDVTRLTIVGGGAKSNLWSQIKADVTGLPVRVPINTETTATGAAMLAAIGSGLYPDVAGAVDAFVSYHPDALEPDAHRHQQYQETYAGYRELYYAVRPLTERSVPSVGT